MFLKWRCNYFNLIENFSGKDDWNYSMKAKNFYRDETFFTILDETFFQADENLKMKMKAFKLFK